MLSVAGTGRSVWPIGRPSPSPRAHAQRPWREPRRAVRGARCIYGACGAQPEIRYASRRTQTEHWTWGYGTRQAPGRQRVTEGRHVGLQSYSTIEDQDNTRVAGH